MKDKESKWQVELVEITKIYKDTIAVNNSNIKIKAGEFFSLLGPSGCGKTTTLRIIAGLEEPDEGKVFLEGRDVTNVPAHRRNVNTVFQDYAIFPHMSVYDNVYFPLKMRKISKKEADPRIKRVLKLSGRLGVASLSKEGKGSFWFLRFYEWLHQKFPKYVTCRPIYVEQTIKDAGFDIVKSEEFMIMKLVPWKLVIAVPR